MKCVICDTPLVGRQTRYCSRYCMQRLPLRKLQSAAAKKLRGDGRRLVLLERFGNCCSICGYNKNTSALHFHHKDPTTKNFCLAPNILSSKTILEMNTEAEKCILLCANCHAELHNPQFSL